MLDTDIELGHKVRDRVSGYTGIVTTVGDHITGCTRVGVTASETGRSDAKTEEFFYHQQLEVVDSETSFADEAIVEDVPFETGQRLRDEVTGFKGCVSVVNYQLYNCPSVLLTSEASSDASETGDDAWFDWMRLEEVPGESFVDKYDEYKQAEADDGRATATGAVADSAPSNDSASMQ